MKFSIVHLSFFVIQTEGEEGSSAKRYKHYQTMDHGDYEDSELKSFMDGEFSRTAKRKADKHPNAEQVPTKIGAFIVEPGHELTSNPNYNLLQRLRAASDKDAFYMVADELARIYLETSAVRGGALIVAQAKLPKYFDEPFVFVFKCDFESKIARVADEKSLISRVEMAISARNMKSIQYPHMPEEGMLEEGELKIHQANHARYFEEFLKFVTYEKSVPEWVGERMVSMVQQYVEEVYPEKESEERRQEEQRMELWAAGEKRELQEKWPHERVVEAAREITEFKQDLELRFKLDGIQVKASLQDYGDRLHIARLNGRYVVLIDGEGFEFDRSVSPIELLHPEDFEQAVERIRIKAEASRTDGDVPW